MSAVQTPTPIVPSESRRLDEVLAKQIEEPTRAAIWAAAAEILGHGEHAIQKGSSATGLALGYVQSGKTTTMTALMAAAADKGYRLIICFLGSTNLLLDQNSGRIHSALGINTRTDYRWVSLRNPSGVGGRREVRDWLGRGRVVVLTVLKHAGRIDQLAAALKDAVPTDGRVLIVDDEADQASLNTKVNAAAESSIYAAISGLRSVLPPHLYVQFTATPYAPLLLDPADHLLPNFVVFLQPGRGYTGGREFFVDYAPKVIRPIPSMDEQAPKTLPTALPKSLLNALANYIVGAGLLLEGKSAAPPMSMLIHSTQRNDVQARYFYLLERVLRSWRESSLRASSSADLPAPMAEEHARLVAAGAIEVSEATRLERIRYVLREIKTWLVNSQSDVKKIDWNVAPFHILLGGNKLDRGFTVEGLTVTYMNRPTADQIDTLEQRARAFGYRSDLLPYCQFFATPRTLKVLRDVVFTEYDLRARLHDWLAGGGTVQSWATEVGLMLPEGSKPTRENVLRALNSFNTTTHWHSLRRPALSPAVRRFNLELLSDLGLFGAAQVDYGRLWHRTLLMPLGVVLETLIKRWRFASYSPDWRHEEIVNFLERHVALGLDVPVILLEGDAGQPRRRAWDEQTGFVNLFQGADTSPPGTVPRYPGDRNVLDLEENPDQIVLQVHHVQPRGMDALDDLYTLAIHLGDRANVTRGLHRAG